MRRVLRSKPVVLIGGGALLRRVMNNAQMRRKRRRRVGRTLTGLALASAAGGAVRYFTDSISGSRRRQKLMRLMGKAEGPAETWTSSDGDSAGSVQPQDSAPSQT